VAQVARYFAKIGQRGITGSLVVLGLIACSGHDRGANGRLVAVHNALQAMGFTQLGELGEGALLQGRTQSQSFVFADEDCHVFVVFGGPGVRNIDLALVSPQGETVARDETTDAQAVLRACTGPGDFTLNINMASGQGRFSSAHWSGGEFGPGDQRATASPTGAGAGTCGQPYDLALGETVSGDTSQFPNQTSGRCVAGEAPDVAYRFSLDQRANVCIEMTSTYDGALVLQRDCGQSDSELACNDDAPDTRHSALRELLEPGTYYLLASGYAESRGSYSITTSVAASPDPAAMCQQASLLTPGQTVQGTTAGCLPDTFQATCAAGARSAEKVYRLQVPARSRLRVDAFSNNHDGALYLRSQCADANSELICNDDHTNNRHSLVTATVDPGTYYVFVDGYGEGQQGAFTLRSQVTPLQAAPVPGDSCASAQPLSPGHVLGTTMPAHADLTGSCAPDGDAPDLVYSLQVSENSRLRARLTRSDLRAALYLQSSCGQPSSEVACVTGQTGAALPSLERVLSRGQYFLVVDGLSENEFGEFEMDLELTSTRDIERQCRAATLLRPGTPVTGTTSGMDEFHASCGDGAQSGEDIYRLRLTRRQRVRVSLESSYDAVLYLRRSCLDESTEVACNDDHQDTRNSMVEATLDRGTYYVFVDGFSSGNQGQYTLRVESSNP
jgi:hypothetical protein